MIARRFRLILLLALSLASSTALRAQDNGFRCGANELSRMASLINNDPARYEDIQEAKDQLEHFTATWHGDAARGGDPYVVPIVFHIIHNNGPENISDEQVRDAVRIMNQDYNKLNPDWPNVQSPFLGIVANVGVTFKLAQLDPDGNCTNGITRTVSPLTNDGGQDMKDLIDWPRDRYLNVWVAASAGGAAGYSMYPSSVAASWGAAADGIVVLSTYVGSIGTSDPTHEHTMSHEAGHWMNLKHCWGDTNTPGSADNCSIDDGVADTPNTVGWDHCDLNGASCGSLQDNVENFMEYSYCSKMFTEGQKERMLAALASDIASRNNIWTSANLALTGVLGNPVLCRADLNSDKRTVCAGDAVTFSDESYSGVTAWNWAFAGGTPSSSTLQDPVVTYDTPGTYDVMLSAGNGTDTVDVTKHQYIEVLPHDGLPLPFSEGFENVASVPSANWAVNDIDMDGTFQVSGTAAYTGAHSIHLSNTSSNTGRTDELISNTIDLTADTNVIISFRFACARRIASNTDNLKLYVSNDCGLTWSLRRALSGNLLYTAPDQGGQFIPLGPSQWGYAETATLTAGLLVPDLRIKFDFTSGGGNDLWLDDININGASTVGIADVGSMGSSVLRVLPNPVGQQGTVVADLVGTGPVQLELLDVLGRPVRTIDMGVRPSGTTRWALPLDGLASGPYLVRLEQGGSVRTARFMKE